MYSVIFMVKSICEYGSVWIRMNIFGSFRLVKCSAKIITNYLLCALYVVCLGIPELKTADMINSMLEKGML